VVYHALWGAMNCAPTFNCKVQGAIRVPRLNGLTFTVEPAAAFPAGPLTFPEFSSCPGKRAEGFTDFRQRFTRVPGLQAIRGYCPAKVNLYLKVLGKRPDGYHDLVTVMQPLSLADELTVTWGGDDIRLACDAPELPRGKDNLVWRAALAFAGETGRTVGAGLSLRKKIPVAAGLGGGSSDAAGTLLALNALAGEPLDGPALHRLAGRLGADVPFFLDSGPVVARGIGTELKPMELPSYWYLLLNPGVPISTRWVYESLDLPELTGQAPPVEADFDPERPEAWVANDLETVTLGTFPQLRDLIGRLKTLGAGAAGMSGSGPTVFGIFATREAARAAAAEVRRTFADWLAVARGLTWRETDLGWEKDAWTI